MNRATWKPNWDDTRRRFVDWWNGKGFIIGAWQGSQLVSPHAPVPDPGGAASLEQQWLDVEWRAQSSRYQASRTGFPFESLPVADPSLGPGAVAAYLGSPMRLQPGTIWYDPCVDDPEKCGPIRFNPENPTWKLQMELIDRMMAVTHGNYLVGCPDIAENWDILGSLRDSECLLADMLDRPGWVKEKIEEINQAYFEMYDLLYQKIRAQDGESMFGWFRLWAPGRVAKVQCDGCSMFSPHMFREFVVPALTAQCEWLDYSVYHLDGSQCLDKLDALLEIEALTAIEWTPDPKVPRGGSPHWYDMYRRILAAGKRVLVLGAATHEIEPLLDAVGHGGVYFLSWSMDEAGVERLTKVVERLR